MTTVLLVRHGLTDANASGVLAGWTPGVHLAEKGREQATALAERLWDVPIAGIVSSPLERCQETAKAIARGRDLKISTDKKLGEAKYGDWTGQPLKTLMKDPLWKVVQAHPSAVRFPNGESMPEMQTRAVESIRAHNKTFGYSAIWVAVSHGDVIKSILADALGMHLDAFQRITVDPCSLSVINYTDLRPFVGRMNDKGAPVADLIPTKKQSKRKASSDAVVGGGAGA